MSKKRSHKLRYFIFSLIPVCVLCISLEALARVLDWAEPELVSLPLPDHFQGLTQPDEDLFWVLKPETHKLGGYGEQIRVNKQGFRGPDLKEKEAAEFRILSLGESTAFGAGVEEAETYAARLAAKLNAVSGNPQKFNVLNCGFSAYSSYQMLVYLEKYGLSFQPDMVILYSEVNDYLPTSFRNEGNDESTFALTDQEFAAKRSKRFAISLIKHSRFLTFLHYRMEASRLREKSQAPVVFNPMNGIGIMGDDLLPERIFTQDDEDQLKPADIQQNKLGQRVKSTERKNNLNQFVEICKKQQIPLLIIHPAYRETRPHRCILTQFCEEKGLDFVDAYPALHVDTIAIDRLYLDSWHPSSLGHERLAEALFHTIIPILGK